MKQKQRLLMMLVMGLASFIYASAQTLTINSSNYTTYLNTPNAQGRFTIKNASDLINKKKIVIASTVPDAYKTLEYVPTADAHPLANLEEIELQTNHPLRGIVIPGTKLAKVTVNKGKIDFTALNIQNGRLTLDNIILHSSIKLQQFTLNRNQIRGELGDKFYGMLSTTLASNDLLVQINGGKYTRSSYAFVDDGMYNPTNLIRNIDMTRIPETMRTLLIRHHLFESVDFSNHPNITQTELNNNLMWSIDLSYLTGDVGVSYEVSPQKPVADMAVKKGAAMDGSQDEIRLYLPEGQSALFKNDRLVSGSVKLLGTAVKTQAIQGTSTEKYFKVASVADGQKADLNLYGKHNGFSYQYNTRPALDDSYGDKKYTTVEVKTYPYIMYINPASKSSNVNYYSGTLWLDYDAIVPPNTTVWIVTDIKSKESIIGGGTAEPTAQLVMEKIGEPGQLIPAGTAMYVRSEAKEGEGAAGFYAFHKAWTHDMKGWDGETPRANKADTLWYDKILTTAQQNELAAQRELIGDRNLLEGYGTDKVFDNEREALILGLENQKGTGRIGFWPFNGTVVPAHRAFISEATYRSKVGDANAKGAIFFFNDPETTGITHIQNSDATTKNDAWYSLDGRQLTGKPTQKGVYIHKGKKEVVR